MIRNFKTLGLAFVAVIAMTAVVASAAQAQQSTLTTVKGNNASIHATQIGEHKFTLTDHKIGEGFANTTCKKATFTSTTGDTVANGATAITVVPHYTECTSFGLNATVNASACHYNITLTTVLAENEFDGDVDLICGAGAVIITTATCEVKVESQNGLSTLIGTNAGTAEKMDITLHAQVGTPTGTKIKYNVTKDGIGCPLSGTGLFNNGDYTGDTTVTGLTAAGVEEGLTLH